MKKLGGLGWKTKLVVGGLLGMEVIDGLTLITPDGETTLTALPRRDELFNRLIALSRNVGAHSYCHAPPDTKCEHCIAEVGLVLNSQDIFSVS